MMQGIFLLLGANLPPMDLPGTPESGNGATGVELADWIAVGIAIIALGISIWTHFDTKPRLKVSQSTATVLYPSDHKQWPGAARGTVIVEVINEGAQPAQISRISLGGKHQGLFLPTAPEGPTVPYVLEPRGGRVSWSFDYGRIRDLVQSNYHNGEVTLQGVVQTGRRKIQARPVLRVAEFSPARDSVLPPPSDIQKKLLRFASQRSRFMTWLKSWTKRPKMISSTLWYTEEDIDRARGLMKHGFRVYGRWPVPAHHVVAIAEIPVSEGWPKVERLWNIEPVRIPLTWPWQERVVWLPMIPDNHEKSPDTEFWWRCERGGWHQGQFGAHTESAIEATSKNSNP